MTDLRRLAARARNGVASLAQRTLIAAVHGYRFVVRPWLGNRCRFEPSCSSYALQALQRHGATSGTYLAICRVCCCHPWHAGGYDPVPDRVFHTTLALQRRVRRFFRGAARRRSPAPPTSNSKKSP